MPENITEQLMSKIRTGRVKMRARWEVLARAALAVLAASVALLAAFFLAGFVTLTLRTGGLMDLPGFGARGVAAFLYEFPWLIVCLLAALMLGVELYARRWSFAYRLPALVTLVALVLVVGAAGLALDAYLETTCPRGPVLGPAVGTFKAYAARPPDSLHPGAVKSLTEGGYRVTGEDGETFEVLIAPEVRLTAGTFPKVGEDVVIFGTRRGGKVEAHGVMRRPPVPPPLLPFVAGLVGRECNRDDAMKIAPHPDRMEKTNRRWERQER